MKKTLSPVGIRLSVLGNVIETTNPPKKLSLNECLLEYTSASTLLRASYSPHTIPSLKGLPWREDGKKDGLKHLDIIQRITSTIQNSGQREAWHVEDQSLHSDTNPYEEHANSYDEEAS